MMIKDQLDSDMQNWWDKLQDRRQQQPQKPLPQITSETVRVQNSEELTRLIAQKLRPQCDPNSNTMAKQGGNHV